VPSYPLGFREESLAETQFPSRPPISGNSHYGGDLDASPHMLGKLRSRGSQGFASGLQVASLHLRGIAKGRDATAPISSSRPFFYSNRSE
jgi:hypothetical protein